MITSLGERSAGELNLAIGLALPGLLLQLEALNGQLLDLTASLEVAIGATPPDVALLGGAIDAALSIDIPELAVNLGSLTIDLQADLSVDIGRLRLQIQAVNMVTAQLNAAYNSGGVALYHYSGTASQMGAEVSSVSRSGFAGGGPSDTVDALILGTTSPETWAALGVVITTE